MYGRPCKQTKKNNSSFVIYLYSMLANIPYIVFKMNLYLFFIIIIGVDSREKHYYKVTRITRAGYGNGIESGNLFMFMWQLLNTVHIHIPHYHTSQQKSMSGYIQASRPIAVLSKTCHTCKLLISLSNSLCISYSQEIWWGIKFDGLLKSANISYMYGNPLTNRQI